MLDVSGLPGRKSIKDIVDTTPSLADMGLAWKAQGRTLWRWTKSSSCSPQTIRIWPHGVRRLMVCTAMETSTASR
ncbi:hypothetical protein [Nonomuraea rubra]|uniref:hypothetical protein n=1 Tax=Nonomuraea rubra TaxID=46180 RepID=UPI0033F1BC67